MPSSQLWTLPSSPGSRTSSTRCRWHLGSRVRTPSAVPRPVECRSPGLGRRAWPCYQRRCTRNRNPRMQSRLRTVPVQRSVYVAGSAHRSINYVAGRQAACVRQAISGWVAGAVGARMRTDGRADGDGLLHHFGVCVLSLVLLWVGSGREWPGVVGSGHASSSHPATAAPQG